MYILIILLYLLKRDIISNNKYKFVMKGDYMKNLIFDLDGTLWNTEKST